MTSQQKEAIMKVGEPQSPEEEDMLSTQYKALCLALDNGNIDERNVEVPIKIEYTRSGEQIKEVYKTFGEAKEAFDALNRQICESTIEDIEAAIKFQSEAFAKEERTPNLDCLLAHANKCSSYIEQIHVYSALDNNAYIDAANRDYNTIILKFGDSTLVSKIIKNLKLKESRGQYLPGELVDDLNTLIDKHHDNNAPAELYFERAKQQAKLGNKVKAEQDLLRVYKKGLNMQQLDPLFFKELGDLHISFSKMAKNRENDYHSKSAKMAYRNMFLIKMEITEDLDSELKNQTGSGNYEAKFNYLIALEDILKNIRPEEYLTKKENNQLENTNHLRNRMRVNRGKIDETGFQSYKVRDLYDLKNKKDYFEGNYAFLNNTFTGVVIKTNIMQKYRTASPKMFLLILFLPVRHAIAALLDLLVLLTKPLAYGFGALFTKQTKFLSEADVDILKTHNPESPTGSDVAAPIIQKEHVTIQQHPLRESHSRVDDTKQQMAGFTDDQKKQLETMIGSPGPQTGLSASQVSKEDDVAKLGRGNN